MGFGTLFIGYFFVINISYYAYTDIIGALVMLLALYKLANVNKYFHNAMICSAVFSIFSLSEFVLQLSDMFIQADKLALLSPYVSAARYLFVFVLTLFILRGIHSVATEVDAPSLAVSASRLVPLSSIFTVSGLFELPFMATIFKNAIAYAYFVILLSVVVFTVSTLIVIYKAYMQICMPGDEQKGRKAKDGIMSKFYDSIEKGSREYAEYKNARKQKNTKGKK